MLLSFRKARSRSDRLVACSGRLLARVRRGGIGGLVGARGLMNGMVESLEMVYVGHALTEM